MLSGLTLGMIIAIIMCSAMLIEIIVRTYIVHNITPHEIVIRLSLMTVSVVVGLVFWYALIVLLGGFVFYAFNRWNLVERFFTKKADRKYSNPNDI